MRPAPHRPHESASEPAGDEHAPHAGVEAAPSGDVQRSGRSSKASRTRGEVELVFGRNKSAIYALYARDVAPTTTIKPIGFFPA